MDNTTTGDEKSSNALTAKPSLSDAIQIVNAAIREKEDQLTRIANMDDLEPVEIEGETITKHEVILMVDPKIPARILLEYNYPTLEVLRNDPPQEMWDDLAKAVGLRKVTYLDM